MIGGLITVACLLLITFVLLSRIRFSAEAEKGDAFKLKCKFWFFTIFELLSDEKSIDEQKIEAKHKQTTKSKSLDALNIRIKTYDDVIQLLHTVKNILYKFKRLIKHIVIKNTEFRLVVVGNDAADTAVKYGAVCSAVYPVLTLLAECFTFKPDAISVSAGFDKKEMDFLLKTDFSVRIIYLLIFALSAIKEYIKLKKELQ